MTSSGKRSAEVLAQSIVASRHLGFADITAALQVADQQLKQLNQLQTALQHASAQCAGQQCRHVVLFLGTGSHCTPG
jgi:hypothetical protein